jgi:hypothetical protein
VVRDEEEERSGLNRALLARGGADEDKQRHGEDGEVLEVDDLQGVLVAERVERGRREADLWPPDMVRSDLEIQQTAYALVLELRGELAAALHARVEDLGLLDPRLDEAFRALENCEHARDAADGGPELIVHVHGQ